MLTVILIITAWVGMFTSGYYFCRWRFFGRLAHMVDVWKGSVDINTLVDFLLTDAIPEIWQRRKLS